MTMLTAVPDLQRPTGTPLVLGRATTVVTTTIATVSTWTPLDIGTLTELNVATPAFTPTNPDWTIGNIDGDDHDFTPNIPRAATKDGPYRWPINVYGFSTFMGHATTGAKAFTLGLFDVQDGTSDTEREALWMQSFPAVDDDQDELTFNIIAHPRRGAELRFYVKGDTDATNFEFDLLDITFKMIV